MKLTLCRITIIIFMSVLLLPDTLECIVLFLPFHDVVTLSVVNKTIHSIVNHPDTWDCIGRTHYPTLWPSIGYPCSQPMDEYRSLGKEVYFDILDDGVHRKDLGLRQCCEKYNMSTTSDTRWSVSVDTITQCHHDDLDDSTQSQSIVKETLHSRIQRNTMIQLLKTVAFNSTLCFAFRSLFGHKYSPPNQFCGWRKPSVITTTICCCVAGALLGRRPQSFLKKKVYQLEVGGLKSNRPLAQLLNTVILSGLHAINLSMYYAGPIRMYTEVILPKIDALQAHNITQAILMLRALHRFSQDRSVLIRFAMYGCIHYYPQLAFLKRPARLYAFLAGLKLIYFDNLHDLALWVSISSRGVVSPKLFTYASRVYGTAPLLLLG
eukprot:PhF_6_TR40166/c0_g1_i9/m.59491